MNRFSDQQLLREYGEYRSEPAFAELVRRYVDFVFSVALRIVRERHLAEDVTQNAFFALAQNSNKLTALCVLSGWLHRTTRNIALNTVRTDVRRRIREQEAVAMNTNTETEATWEEISTALDAALDELNDGDRDVVLLRFIHGKSAAEIANIISVSEVAAQKRLNRAIHRLRNFFKKRGITVGTPTLFLILPAKAIQGAPAELVTTITTTLFQEAIRTSTIFGTCKVITTSTFQKTILTATLASVVATTVFIQDRALAKARSGQSFLRAKLHNISIQTPELTPVHSTGNSAEREELERLRTQAAMIRAQVSGLSAKLESLGAEKSSEIRGTPLNEVLQLSGLRDVGQSTPAALLQTHLWAMMHGDTNRLAQLMAFSSQTDMAKVQRLFEKVNEEAPKGMDVQLSATPILEIRLLEEQPAENNDRWVIQELVNRNGETIDRERIRVRSTSMGWKLVIGVNGKPEEESIEEQL